MVVRDGMSFVSYCVDWKIDLQMQISAHVVKEGNSSETSALQLIYEERERKTWWLFTFKLTLLLK